MRIGRKVKNKIADDRGISLVELVVVIAIMAVMIGITSLGIGMMFSRDANYVAVRIDDTMTEARTLSMSSAGVYSFVLHIDSNIDDQYVQINRADAPGGTPTPYRTIKLEKNVTITTTGVTADDDGNITIVFDKANGSVKQVNGSKPASGAVYTFTVASNRNASNIKDVSLIATTGRHYTEK